MLLSMLLKEMGDFASYCERDEPFLNMSMLLKGYGTDNSCVFITDIAYLKKCDDKVRMVITTSEIAEQMAGMPQGVCITDDPRNKFYEIHNYLAMTSEYKRRQYDTEIGQGCSIAKLSDIAEKNVTIGNHVTIEPFVCIKENTSIGDGTIIRSGAVIGNPGYDYKAIRGQLTLTSQVGGVVIGKNVEVNSNTCVERATFPYEDTIIGNESKIGALCYIAHGVKIGQRVFMPNCVSVSGYTRIDDDVNVGPGATISNVIHIGEGVHITIGSVVCNNVRKDGHVTGNFAIPHDKFLEHYRNSLS